MPARTRSLATLITGAFALAGAFAPSASATGPAGPSPIGQIAVVPGEPASAPEPKFQRLSGDDVRSRKDLPDGVPGDVTILNESELTPEQRRQEAENLKESRVLWQMQWALQRGYKELAKKILDENSEVVKIIPASATAEIAAMTEREGESAIAAPASGITFGIHNVSSSSRGSMISLNKWCGTTSPYYCGSTSAQSKDVDATWDLIRVYPGNTNPRYDDDGVVSRAECTNTYTATFFGPSDSPYYMSGGLTATRAYKISDFWHWTTSANGTNCRG
ncbi:MAG: hypothetical protein Q4F65_11900 [Propionibacteriaceae bacterium]|nr:hypothetical protein [Propionibacteriaceae bacterium]